MSELHQILATLRDRYGIPALNAMQESTLSAWHDHPGDIVLYSPTGSGKTLAFSIVVLESCLNALPAVPRPIALVVSPSRELVMQTTEVLRSISGGMKVTCCYGGHAAADERHSLSVPPDVLVGTPGRLLDHANHRRIDLRGVQYLVLDEFDKTLELGFENEMRRLLEFLPDSVRRLLTSATVIKQMPPFMNLRTRFTLDFLSDSDSPASRMLMWQVLSASNDKLESLRGLLLTIAPRKEKTIVFVNYRESVQRVTEYLRNNNIESGAYHGAMQQFEREKVVAMFNNGTLQVLVATDLASRGLDVEDVGHVVHYHRPVSPEAFAHRNGRTARVDASGQIYIITSPAEKLPDWIPSAAVFTVAPAVAGIHSSVATVYFQAGKKEKLSRGDIMGFVANHADGVKPNEIGRIEVRDHYSLVALPRDKAQKAVIAMNQCRIKGAKVRISLISP